MNHFVAGILRIVLLEAGVALIVLARVLAAEPSDTTEGKRRARRLNLGFIAVAALSVFAWTNFGSLRGNGEVVHRWEQFHFFFGSKYLREVGYFDLYRATVLADREGDHLLDRAPTLRDLSTFDEVPQAQAMTDSAQVRAKFTDARWAAFKSDWLKLSRGDSIWSRAITDHGNSGSPAWAVFAAPFAYLFGISRTGQVATAFLDVLLIVGLFWAIFRVFGLRASCISLWIFAMVPFSFDYLAGSFLRWDWLFALALCLVCWKQKRSLTAGAFLGYAIASKLFPLFFGVAFAIKLAWDFARSRKLDPRIIRFCAGAAIAIAVSVLVSTAIFGASIWPQYAKRIEVAQREKFYSNQYSFRTVFLQLAVSTGAELEDSLLLPREIKQGRNDVDIREYRFSYLICQLALTALVAFALGFVGELEALAVGPLLVFVWLTVNAYYWNMLCLPALIWATREEKGKRGALTTLIILHAALAGFYLYQHLNHGQAEGYVGGIAMLVLLFVWSLSTLLRGRDPEPVETPIIIATGKPLRQR